MRNFYGTIFIWIGIYKEISKSALPLIGAYTYWEFVTGETQRDKSCSLVAQKSIFGYLVSGPLMNDSILKQLSPTHVIKFVCNQDNSLNERIDKFWDLDTTEIKENETSDILVI